MAATLTLLPPLPAEDADPAVTAAARALLAEGFTPADLAPYPALSRALAAPMAALTARSAP